MIAQDLDTIRIWPVVKHGSEEVNFSAFDGLLVREIISHEFDAVGQLARYLWRICDHVGKVLNNETEIGVFFGETYTDWTVAAADIDNGRLPQSCLLPVSIIATWEGKQGPSTQL